MKETVISVKKMYVVTREGFDVFIGYGFESEYSATDDIQEAMFFYDEKDAKDCVEDLKERILGCGFTIILPVCKQVSFTVDVEPIDSFN